MSNNANLQSFIIGQLKNVNQNVLNGSCGIKQAENVRISVMKLKLSTKHQKNVNQIVLNGNYIIKLVKNVKTYVVKSKVLTPQPKNVMRSVKLLLNGIILHKNVFVIKVYSFLTIHVYLKQYVLNQLPFGIQHLIHVMLVLLVLLLLKMDLV